VQKSKITKRHISVQKRRNFFQIWYFISCFGRFFFFSFFATVWPNLRVLSTFQSSLRIANCHVRMSKQAASDYTWSYTEEPHKTRRKEILAAHPEVRDLFGFDPASKYWVFLSVFLQFTTAWLLRDQSWWVILFIAYVWGGTINHSLNLAGHELAHNLFFDNPVHNTLFGFIANLPMPLAITVYVHHMAQKVHHKVQLRVFFFVTCSFRSLYCLPTIMGLMVSIAICCNTMQSSTFTLNSSSTFALQGHQQLIKQKKVKRLTSFRLPNPCMQTFRLPLNILLF
jgi:hypothetical protein